jgi:hypothetical protein
MKKELTGTKSSEFKDLAGIEYFEFEEDFIEENVRCIPMIVRFKMDTAGIKLKLSEWSKFSIKERIELALKPCGNKEEVNNYKDYLSHLVLKYTGKEATPLDVETHPAWADLENINEALQEKAKEFEWKISIDQWTSLTNLQRFVLLKLCRPGHENKNFPKAMREFSLI